MTKYSRRDKRIIKSAEKILTDAILLEKTEVLVSPNYGFDKIYQIYIDPNTKELIVVSEE